MNDPSTVRQTWADALRVVATIGVVFLHAAAPLAYRFNTVDLGSWWVSNAVDSCFRWAVPVFIMLSGMLLLDGSKTDEPIGLFFKKRLNKVLVPFLAWSVIYYFWRVRQPLLHGQANCTAGGFLTDLLRGSVYFHLGFLYYLIGLYLITPVLRPYVKHASNTNMVYFLTLWLIATPLYGVLARYLNLQPAIQLYLVTGFVGYFVMGSFLNRIEIRPHWRVASYAVAGVCLMATAYGTYVATRDNGGTLDEYFYDYLTINVIFLSAAVFLGFKYARWPWGLPNEPSVLQRCTARLAGASLGVYLIHPIILELLSEAKVNSALYHPLLGIPLTAAIAIVISFVIVLILQMVPLARRMVP